MSVLVFIWSKLLAAATSPVALRNYAIALSLLLLTFIADYLRGANWRRFFGRRFFTDFAYFIFYYAGFFGLLWSPFGRACMDAIRRFVPFLDLGAMRHWSMGAQVLTWVVVSDLLHYIQHRLMHRVPALWSIHQIHHGQSEMTVFTNYRFHPFEEASRHIIAIVPLAILGTPPRLWLLVDVISNWLLLMQHSQVHWSFGWFDRVFCSPHYHEVHHAITRDKHDQNYGLIFSFWDRLFGTQDLSPETVREYGIERELPEGFFRQFFIPLRDWRDMLRLRERPVTVVATPETPVT
jgi:sterol desaturase/sphingolipid hydroxylase (fatty acid hydroxylase superfamily)